MGAASRYGNTLQGSAAAERTTADLIYPQWYIYISKRSTAAKCGNAYIFYRRRQVNALDIVLVRKGVVPNGIDRMTVDR